MDDEPLEPYWSQGVEFRIVHKDRALAAWISRVARDASKLNDAPEEVRACREVALAAVAADGLALRRLPEELRAERRVVLLAIRQNPEALEYAATALQAEPSIVAAAV